MQTTAIVEDLDGPRAAFAALLGLLLGGLLLTSQVPITLSIALTALLGLAFFVVNAVDSVREHPLYHLGKAAWAATMLGLFVASGLATGWFAYLVFALTCLAVGTEVYNYRHGTAYLRVDA